MHAASAGGGGGRGSIVMPRAGDVIAGKYAIVRVIGEGGMGVVYEANHQRLRQRVAIKMLLPHMLEHEVVVSRFEREARAVAQLRGRHVARVTDVDVTADGLPYMVMEFLEGHDLQVELERRGRLPLHEAVDYVLQACAAMVEAHKAGIVHRDLKPSNLFLERHLKHESDGDNTRIVKVLDFGISKVFENVDEGDAKLTEVDAIVGTAMYMSPEQIRASHAVDGRSDIWALGVILYEALAGRVPWLGAPSQIAAAIVSEDAPALNKLCTIPTDLSAIVHKTLERDTERRFADVKQLASALLPFAPQGSAGRSFAENLFASGSHPRLALPVGAVVDNAKTILNATTDPSRPDGGTAPGWSQRPPAPSRGRAALIGVLAAFVFGLVTIGGVAVFIRPRAGVERPMVVTSTTSTSTLTTSSVAPPASSEAPREDPSVVPVAPPPPSVTTATVTVRPPHSAAVVKPPAPPVSTKPVTKPTPSAAPSDKPLFL